jgi:serine/threonine protein kinase
MNEERTTAVIQRYLDALQGDSAAEPIIRELLERAVERLRILCGSLLRRSYPRLTQPPLNLETDELLDGVVAGLMTALQKVRPQTVRQFFALANHLRLNRPVALKMLLAGDYARPAERERIQREAEAIAALHHPNQYCAGL